MAEENRDTLARMNAAAERFRGEGGLGRSDLLIQLFDFLLSSSLAGRSPKELEIGLEVFSRGSSFDALQDSSVRVYVHRLRKKLASYYADAPPEADRLEIPRGEYRLILANGGEATESASGLTVRERVGRRLRSGPWLALLALVLVNAGVWALYVSRSSFDRAPPAAKTSFWKPLRSSKLPTIVTAGDYYIFGEADDGFQVKRLIREFSINSRDDLDHYLLGHPVEAGTYVDVDLHYLPVSAGTALRNILPVVNAAVSDPAVLPPVVTTSQLTANDLKTHNIVYVGFLSGLGLLRDPLFESSSMTIGTSYDELVDKATGRRFSSDWRGVADGKVPHRDYGYLASLSGPGGSHILIVAGTRDAAVMQAAEIAIDPAQLAAIEAKAGTGDFEALYEVQTMGNLNLGSQLVLARSIRAPDIWKAGKSEGSAFPDQLDNSPRGRR